MQIEFPRVVKNADEGTSPTQTTPQDHVCEVIKLRPVLEISERG